MSSPLLAMPAPAAFDGTGLTSYFFTEAVTVTYRGVIGIGETCPACDRPAPVIGAVGKGRPLDTFAPGYFCHGHAVPACGCPDWAAPYVQDKGHTIWCDL